MEVLVVRVGGRQNEPRTVSDKCENRGILEYGLQYLGTDVSAVCSAGKEFAEEKTGRSERGRNVKRATEWEPVGLKTVCLKGR